MNDRSQLRTTADWTPQRPSAEIAATETWPNSPGTGPVDPGPSPAFPPRYRPLRLLGMGGFGKVYLAVDEQLARQVVLKVPHAGTARSADLEAALREARVIAQLDHPGIVKVFDIAQTGDGRPFLVCQYIAGTNLAQRIAVGRLSYYDSAALATAVARALHFAHQRGVVHRDIKPANILLDQAGTPFVADFGLALTHERLGTGSGSAGTPHYMSPEQASGEGHLVSGSTDIFSLGAVLYELLTGRKPFPGQSVGETIELVRRAQPWPLRQLDPQVPVELERICLKALAKDPAQRYATAGDMAADLERCLPETSVVVPPPIIARPAGAMAGRPAQAPRPATNAKLIAGIAAAGIACVVLLIVAIVVNSQRPHEPKKIAQRPPESPATPAPNGPVETPMPMEPPSASPSSAPPIMTDVVPSPAPPMPTPAPSNPALPTTIPPPFDPSSLATAPPSNFPTRPRIPFPRMGLGREPAMPEPSVVPDAKEELHLTGHTGPVRCLAFARDAALVATGSDDQSVRLWDAKSGESRGVARGYPAAVRSVAMTSDGKFVAFGGDGFGDQVVVVWDVQMQREVARMTWREDISPSRVHGVAFSADGKLLAAASTGPVRVWDWRTKAERHVFTWQETFPSYAYSVAFHPTETTLAAGCHGGGQIDRQDTVRLFDLAKNEPGDIFVSPSQGMSLSHRDVVGALTYSLDGKRLARVSQGGGRLGIADRGNLAVWNLAAPAAPDKYDVPMGKAFALHFGQDDALLVASAAGGEDLFGSSPFADPTPPGQVALWRPSGAVAIDAKHKGRVTFVTFSADGKLLATAGDDGTAKVWSVEKLLAAGPR